MLLAKRILSEALQFRIRKLGNEFARKSDKANKLDQRIKSVGTAEPASPSLLRKMTSWIGKLARIHEEEAQILDEISFIEKKHQALRKNKQLRKAKPVPMIDDRPEPKPRRKSSLFTLVMLYMLFKSDRPEPKR